MSNYQNTSTHHSDSSGNPWADQTSSTENQYQAYAPPPGPPPQAQQYHQQINEQSDSTWQANENPWGDPNIPPRHPQQRWQQQSSAPSLPPTQRSAAFDEEALVPAAERGEQREAIEQFEMNRSRPEDSTDRDVAQLQQEFPALDGSLIAAIYGDSKNMGATREMLQELAATATG